MESPRAAYDIVVLGGGPVGENLAQYATESGRLSAVIVERELVGGECSYYACMPSKALLRPLEVAATAAHLTGLSAPALDRDALLARRDVWVSHYDDAGQVAWARGAGIDVVRGHGRLNGERVVRVDGPDGVSEITARVAVVIATGSDAVIPEMYAASAPWTSRDATGVREVPERLVIIGGGVVACESAIWMAGLGSRVTMLVRDERLLGRVEPFAAEFVRAALVDGGIDVCLEVEVTACERNSVRDNGLGMVHGGPVRLGVDGSWVEADEVLVATGRRARLNDVGLETVGVGESQVRTGDLPDWLVAVGDASGEAPLTHWGKYRARVIGERLAARAATGSAAPGAAGHVAGPAVGAIDPAEPGAAVVPQVVFTDAQVASVGMTEKEARAAYPNVVVSQVPWTSAAGASLLRDDATGAAQLVVDHDTALLLGATFVGPDAGELLHAATIAIVGRVPVPVLRHAVPSYPTASELWLRLLEALPVDLRHR